jgi:hypothetical protein
MNKIVLLLSVMFLSSCATTWQNYHSEFNNQAQFSQDRAYCQLYSNSAVREVQALQQNTDYGTTKTSAALIGTSNALNVVATSIGTFDNCMMAKGWYKVKNMPPTTAESNDNSISSSTDSHCVGNCLIQGNTGQYCMEKCR